MKDPIGRVGLSVFNFLAFCFSIRKTFNGQAQPFLSPYNFSIVRVRQTKMAAVAHFKSVVCSAITINDISKRSRMSWGIYSKISGSFSVRIYLCKACHVRKSFMIFANQIIAARNEVINNSLSIVFCFDWFPNWGASKAAFRVFQRVCISAMETS